MQNNKDLISKLARKFEKAESIELLERSLNALEPLKRPAATDIVN